MINLFKKDKKDDYKEKEYYQKLGIEKSLIDMAFEHNFLQKKIQIYHTI